MYFTHALSKYTHANKNIACGKYNNNFLCGPNAKGFEKYWPQISHSAMYTISLNRAAKVQGTPGVLKFLDPLGFKIFYFKSCFKILTPWVNSCVASLRFLFACDFLFTHLIMVRAFIA